MQGLIDNATSSFQTTVGFAPSSVVTWMVDNLLKPLIGGGVDLLYELRYVIIAVLVIFAIVMFSKRAYRFFAH